MTEALNNHTVKKEAQESTPSSKISRFIIVVSALALSVIGGCNKPQHDGSKHLKPALHLSCALSAENSHRSSLVTNISNVKLTRDNQGTYCTYYTSDMSKVGEQIPVTVSCRPKEKNHKTISRKIDGITIEVKQANTICEITNK